jgi:hypothetical protein
MLVSILKEKDERLSIYLRPPGLQTRVNWDDKVAAMVCV